MTQDEIARLSRRHLEAVVAIDSQSDERSSTVPSSEGQRRLADWLALFFAEQGASVERGMSAERRASSSAMITDDASACSEPAHSRHSRGAVRPPGCKAENHDQGADEAP